MNKKIKILFLLVSSLFFVSCNNTSSEITLISREDGSGTRDTFIELFDIRVKDNETIKDLTSKEAIITNKTDVMMTNIINDKNAIGYISLGSMNDNLKAVQINEVEASSENVRNGSYEIVRNFNIVTKEGISDLTKDFITFILSKDGQEIVSHTYISSVDSDKSFKTEKLSGKIVIAGSSSVTPLMEKLKEAYEKINTNATVEIQMSDSTSGIRGLIDGNCDLAMSSRSLKENEKTSLAETTIAFDAIVIIINKENPIDNLTKSQVKSIFTGEITDWNEVPN